MIFVAHVQSGMEHDVVSSLREKNIYACSPTHDLLERKKKVWHTVRRLIFPGYVFIIADSISDKVYYTVRNTNGVVRFLGKPPTPLPMSEQYRLIWILETENLTVSKGCIKDGRVTFTDGILAGREHYILKYSKRRKRCTLYCEINGKRHYFDVSAELEKI